MKTIFTSIIVLIFGAFAANARQAEKLNGTAAVVAMNSEKTVPAKEDPKKEDPQKEGSEKPQAAAESPVQTNTFLSAWGTMQQSLVESGFDLKMTYKSDNCANVSGGLGRGSAYIQNLDFTATIDGGKAIGLSGASFFVHVLSNNGGSINAVSGDAQMVSNIEAPRLFKLYQLWVQKEWADGSASVLAGLFDLNSEFYVTSSSALFLNGSHGIGKEISQTGQNGPSVFPNTSLALRLKIQPAENLYVQTVVLDAVPGTAADPCATSFHIDAQEGALLVTEFGYGKDATEGDASSAKVGVGMWHYTSSFDEIAPDADGNAVASRANSGIYVLAEKYFPTAGGSGMAFFARAGICNSKINPFSSHYGFGMVYTGLFAGREEDEFGIALAHAQSGAAFRFVLSEEGGAPADAETTIELTYRAHVTPWLAIQPNIQHILQPGADRTIRDATVVGARLEFSL